MRNQGGFLIKYFSTLHKSGVLILCKNFIEKGLTFLCGHVIISLYPQRKEVRCLGIKKGTKLTETPKDKMLKIRIDSATERKLEVICVHTEKSKSEVVRKGIEKQYAEIQGVEDD